MKNLEEREREIEIEIETDNYRTSALSRVISVLSCCCSEIVVKIVSLETAEELAEEEPHLGQEPLLIISLIAWFSSRIFSISPFNNAFSWRS